MPNVKEYTDEKEWMSVCMPAMMGEGKEQDQAAAACMQMWKDRDKPEPPEPAEAGVQNFFFTDLLADLEHISVIDGMSVTDRKSTRLTPVTPISRMPSSA